MSYSSNEWQDWVKNEEESLNLIGKAYETGINFFDTANVYSSGESKRVLGKAIERFDMARSRIVIDTKAYYVANEENPPTKPFVDIIKGNRHINGFVLSRNGIATIPYAPLVLGILAGKNLKTNHEVDKFRDLLFVEEGNNDGAIVDRVIETAEKCNYSPA
ncbi:unnamed protein product [Rhizopus stolonifer]